MPSPLTIREEAMLSPFGSPRSAMATNTLSGTLEGEHQAAMDPRRDKKPATVNIGVRRYTGNHLNQVRNGFGFSF